MSCSLWAYCPTVCDGDYCPRNCDRCPKMEEAVAVSAEEACDPEWDLEVGFDVYEGCYTYDC